MPVDLKTRARQAVALAITSKKLSKEICQNCQSAFKIQAHHHKGYARENWLEIQWLCGRCHYQVHHSMPKQMTAKQKQIVRLYQQGKSKRSIALKVGVSRTYVCTILRANKLIK